MTKFSNAKTLTSFGTIKFSGIEFQLVWEKMVANHNIHLIQLKWSNFWTDRNWFQFHTSHVSLFETESGITPFFFFWKERMRPPSFPLEKRNWLYIFCTRPWWEYMLRPTEYYSVKKKRETNASYKPEYECIQVHNYDWVFFLMERHTITCM